MKVDDATRAEIQTLRDQLRSGRDLTDQEVVRVIRVMAALDRTKLIQAIADDYEYRRNRKRLLKVLPLQTTAAA